MGKGDTTKQTILDHALQLATSIGLDALTIGRLATELKLSKSGLFAHFQSKEALQVQVLETAARRFEADVIKPSLKAARGLPRLTAIFDNWRRWSLGIMAAGHGCPFFAVASELDDRPGPVRDELVRIQRAWFELIASVVRQGVDDGLLDDRADPEQFAQDLYGILLSCHFCHRLLDDPGAERRACAAFAQLLAPLRPLAAKRPVSVG